ncbi:MAG: hypothetical protein QOJ75_276 [Chloroflexota bacterium]|jgi:hypothetical protein|nr:hypothetical protein [Chloroflexota bacterium]
MADQTAAGLPGEDASYSRHLRGELRRLETRAEKGDPLWPAQLAVAIAIALHLALSDKLVIGPKYLVPGVEGLLLLTLVVIAPARANHSAWRHQRGLLWTILGLVTLSYLVSLGLLVHYLVTGGRVGGHALIGSGVVLWVTNVLLFSVVYWDLDRGGPLNRFEREKPWPDFLFPQMDSPEFTPMEKKWQPSFLDYFYTALTNATAFSPTDTMPLTQTAKLLMSVQGTAAIVTVGLVLARAVNILG